jgi:hypothetical protein
VNTGNIAGEAGRLTAFQQHPDCTAAPGLRGCLAERQYLRMLGQPVAGMDFQYAVPSFATPSLAVDHADAAQPALRCVMQKLAKQLSRRIRVQAVQIKFVLRRPFTAPQFAQGHPVQTGAQEFGDRAVARTVIGQDVCNGSGNRGITPGGFARPGGWRDAIGWCKRRDAFQCLPEQVCVLFRLFLHQLPQ